MLEPGTKIKVLIVDDSAVIRKIVAQTLSHDKDIEVVGTANDPYEARELIIKTRPDVLTLDIEMPRMDGLTFLKILMEHHPMPIIIMSSLTQAGSDYAMRALQLGAVEVLAKPSGAHSVEDLAEQLPFKIKAAAMSRVIQRANPDNIAAPHTPSQDVHEKMAQLQKGGVSPAIAVSHLLKNEKGTHVIPYNGPLVNFDPRQIILLGASTGGTEALREVLAKLPKHMPPICLVQHIPAYFSKAFADRLNLICAGEVHEAQDSQKVESGSIVVAPGGHHMVVRWNGEHYQVHLKEGPMVWHQRPAVDVLFNSAVEYAQHATVGLLTGMGKDGAEGMLKLKQAGAHTLAQDKESCVVFGMPRVAQEIGATDKMVSLEQIPYELMRAVGYRL
jgi:two-component system chemotaxis response regulator CheB